MYLMRLRFFLLLSLSWLVAMLGLAGPAQAQAQSRPLKVVASFSILADMAREVAGDTAVVTALVGPDADAHVYEPTPAAVRQMASADLLVVNGLRFEGWLDRLVRISGYKGPVVVATTGLVPRRVNGEPDPHAWHSLAHAHVYIDNLRQALAGAAPAQADAFQARADAYLRQLDALDQRTRAALAAVPVAQRRLITSHDAFGYLGEAYGLTLLSPQGWTTGAEPSAGQVARVIRQVKSEQVRALFLENISDPRLVQRIAAESGARVGGTLYSDALSAPGGPADTYLKLMTHNLDAIRQALAP